MGNESTALSVSFILFAYNQERFIREAVEGAFSQTNSPLEIILSDDGSTDRTFQIMQEMAVAYQGPHRVILNRTERNQGVAHHINSVIPLASGSWLVMAAGDDISLPERVSRLMKFVADNPGVTGICSACRNIDEAGCELEPDPDYQGRDGIVHITECRLDSKRFTLHGATAAWKKELFTSFSPLPSDVIHEDLVLTLRALLCGSVLALPDILVYYRRWGGNNSAGADLRGKSFRQQVEAREERSARWNRLLAAAYRQMRVDLGTNNVFRKEQSANEKARIAKELNLLISAHAMWGEWWCYTFAQRVRLLVSQTRSAPSDRKTCLRMLPRVFGLKLFAGLCAFMKKLKAKQVFTMLSNANK